ncbi:unnamed protein product [Prunus armeniaca]
MPQVPHAKLKNNQNTSYGSTTFSSSQARSSCRKKKKPLQDQCYKAKNLAKERIQGSIEEQYSKLWDYCKEHKRQNPGSIVLVKTSLRGDDPIFERFYICFDQLRKGFIEGCRTMVGFDGAFIKGQHPGQLLSIVGIDANNGMFPIAFAVVETESKDTWTWFLEIFFNDVGVRGVEAQNIHGWA